MENLIKIGVFAKLNKTSVQTLRYYESIGLLTPAYVDPETNYRYYNIMQSSMVDTIHFLKNFDFSLEDITRLLSNQDRPDILGQLVEEQKRQLIKEKEELEKKLQLIHSFQAANEIYHHHVNEEHFELIDFPTRYIFPFQVENNIYEMNEQEYEQSLRTFKQLVVEQNLPLSQFNRVGSLLERRNFEKNIVDSRQMFIFVDGPNTKLPNVKKIPKGRYAILYCRSIEEEVVKMGQLNAELKKRGLRIAGDYLCEVIYELPQINQAYRNMFIRMQVSVY